MTHTINTVDWLDPDAVADAVIAVPAGERAAAYDASLQRTWDVRSAIAEDDAPAFLRFHHSFEMLNYGLAGLSPVLTTAYIWEGYHSSATIAAQVHPRLWEVFTSRPQAEVDQLMSGWWGPDAPVPHALPVLLAWHAAGHVELHRTPGYFEAVCDLVVDATARHDELSQVLADHPFLADDFLAGLQLPGGFQWLAQLDPEALAARMRATEGAIDIGRVQAAARDGLQLGWGGSREHRRLIEEVADALR